MADIKEGIEKLLRAFVQSKSEVIDVIEKQIAGHMEVIMKDIGKTNDDIANDFKKLNPRFADALVKVQHFTDQGEKMLKVVAQIDPTIKNMMRGIMIPVTAGFNKLIRSFDFSSIMKSGFEYMKGAFVSVGASLNAHAERLRASNGQFMSETTAKVVKLLGVGMIALSGITAIIGTLKPVQTIISAIQSVINAIFLPLGLLLMALLLPVLILLAALLRTNLYKELMSFVTKFIGVMIPVATAIAGYIVDVINGITDIRGIISFFVSLGREIWKLIQGAYSFLSGILHPILSGIYAFVGALLTPINLLVGLIKGFTGFTSGASNFFGGIIKGIASLDTGGSIVSSGLAVVHRGEMVIPAGQNQGGSVNNQITIHVHGMDSTSTKNLVDEVMRQIENRTGKSLRWS